MYIYDYLEKMDLHFTANAFQTQNNVSTDPVDIDSPSGFLLEWWSTFWDTFNARTNVTLSESAATYNELQIRMLQMFDQIQQQEELQMQQMLYQEQQQLLDPNYASMLQGQTLHGISGNIQQAQHHNQGLDQLQSGLLQDESLMGSQSLNQLQAQQNPISPSTNDTNMLLEMQQQKVNQYFTQHQQLWKSYPRYQQQDRWTVPGGMAAGGSMSNTSRRKEQIIKPPSFKAPTRRIGKKDKQVLSLPPSTHWTKKLGLPHTDGASRLGPNARNPMKEFKFTEVQVLLPAFHERYEVECCDIADNGKWLATGGRDNKVVIWLTANYRSYSVKSTLEEHSQCITDVRFSPSLLSRFATASADTTVKVWDADNPGHSLCTFTGHSSTVMSLDFSTKDDDIVCSSDNSNILFWSIERRSCVAGIEVGATQLRFQSPMQARLLAAAQENRVYIIGADSKKFVHRLQGHKEKVECLCWDCTGDYLASGLEFWNMSENKRTTVFAQEKVVSAMAVSSFTGCYATVSRGMYVKLWV